MTIGGIIIVLFFYGRNYMFKLKFNLFATMIVLLVLISNNGIAEEKKYTPEMIKNCLKLTENINTSDWLIDKDLVALDESKLNILDDGWNKKINEAHEQMLKICNADKDSDECLLAKQPERQLKDDRRKCYYRVLMKSI
jgi:hypothetical protein